MRFLLPALFLLLASAVQAEDCQLGFARNSTGICAAVPCASKPPKCSVGQVPNTATCPARCTPACPAGYLYNAKMKLCDTVCPNGGTPEVGPMGDRICAIPERLKKAARYAANCEKMGREYLPSLGMCGAKLAAAKKTEKEPAECGRGQVAAFEANTYICKKGSPRTAMKEMQDRLVKTGISYEEYLGYLSKSQTNLDNLRMVRGRLAEYRQEEALKKAGKAPPPARIICAEGYVPAGEGGCRPEKSCNLYRCTDGSVPLYRKQGDYYYCACPE